MHVAALPDRLFERRFGREGRPFGRDVQNAGRAVLAEQGALRTPQQFDLADVERIEHRHAGTSQIHIVEIDTDTAFEAVVRRIVADAPHGDARLPRMDVRDVRARQGVLQILHAVVALRFEFVTAHGRDRRRHFLHVFLAAAGGHDHFLQCRRGGFSARFGGGARSRTRFGSRCCRRRRCFGIFLHAGRLTDVLCPGGRYRQPCRCH